jgi:hypothetical protein
LFSLRTDRGEVGSFRQRYAGRSEEGTVSGSRIAEQSAAPDCLLRRSSFQQQVSASVGGGKWKAVGRLAEEFACDKQRHLEHYQAATNFASAETWRDRRDELKLSDYHRRIHLPVHMSDLAVKEAFETEEKDWAAIAEEIDVSVREWSAGQKRYGSWLLSDPQRFSQLILGRAPRSGQIEFDHILWNGVSRSNSAS